MQADFSQQFELTSPEQTAVFARQLSGILGPGDVLLLEGPIGAGKTHFARALIRHLQGAHGLAEDVPSPTFTLVQTYLAGPLEIWHADLYRLSHPDEVLELGLDEAFETTLCLVEWPDRLSDLTPETALHLSFESTGDDTRRVTLHGPSVWAERLREADL